MRRYGQRSGDASKVQAQADEIEWYHSIDLGNGVRTKGVAAQAVGLEHFPQLAGRTVLDIGAWDGYYSFMAERQGASRVVSLDHYAWGVDFVARGAYWNECSARGELPDLGLDTTHFWREDLPGKRGFDFARSVLESKAEPVHVDFMIADLDALGVFDVVFYLGVLYHVKEPLTALERVRKVTKEVAVIETEALHVHPLEDSSLLLFTAGNEVGSDYSNWYVPTMAALTSMCRAAGFSRVDTVIGPATPPQLEQAADEVPRVAAWHYRAMVHAYP